MRVYISGPMTGLPEFNYPAFFAAEERLKERGHEVINPARPGDEAWGWLEFMRRALCDLSEADAIHMLDGWEKSRGATLERHIADALGLAHIGSEAEA